MLALRNMVYRYIHEHTVDISKSTDHETGFKWSIYGAGRIKELEYLYGRSFGTKTEIDRGEWSTCGGGLIETLYCIYLEIYMDVYIDISIDIFIDISIYMHNYII